MYCDASAVVCGGRGCRIRWDEWVVRLGGAVVRTVTCRCRNRHGWVRMWRRCRPRRGAGLAASAGRWGAAARSRVETALELVRIGACLPTASWSMVVTDRRSSWSYSRMRLNAARHVGQESTGEEADLDGTAVGVRDLAVA